MLEEIILKIRRLHFHGGLGSGLSCAFGGDDHASFNF
jgi:hypothetical protein